MRAAMISEVIIRVSDLQLSIKRMGIMDAETMDPRDMKSDILTVNIKKRMATRQLAGERAR